MYKPLKASVSTSSLLVYQLV